MFRKHIHSRETFIKKFFEEITAEVSPKYQIIFRTFNMVLELILKATRGALDKIQVGKLMGSTITKGLRVSFRMDV